MVITTDNLVKIYNTRHVVDGVSISVEQGSVVGLLGPNGAGKTTTFYMIVGIEKPDAGTVMLDGKDISAMPMYERARAGIGYLPQEASIFSKMTVEDNIMAILETTDLNASEREAKMNALLDEFRLNHVRKSEGKALSGGERRRVEIARALATDSHTQAQSIVSGRTVCRHRSYCRSGYPGHDCAFGTARHRCADYGP